MYISTSSCMRSAVGAFSNQRRMWSCSFLLVPAILQLQNMQRNDQKLRIVRIMKWKNLAAAYGSFATFRARCSESGPN
ncbi:hypothetical protein BDN70DRAFT_193775 [Pholiota conissans]|uniref:Uncharacterized protein n=1 Tax=Pholiota conissans TaxID=109636 RepID=A0A9P5YUM3_9AGAR|nr:hypothetical protein BDN70DRAFT_193775 [Pholiota conissans]